MKAEVAELLALGEGADQGQLPDGLVVSDEVALRQDRLTRLAEAKAVIEARAKERDAAEQAEYEAKVREREEKAGKSGRPPKAEGTAAGPTDAWTAGQGPVQLHRPRLARHEEQHQSGL